MRVLSPAAAPGGGEDDRSALMPTPSTSTPTSASASAVDSPNYPSPTIATRLDGADRNPVPDRARDLRRAVRPTHCRDDLQPAGRASDAVPAGACEPRRRQGLLCRGERGAPPAPRSPPGPEPRPSPITVPTRPRQLGRRARHHEWVRRAHGRNDDPDGRHAPRARRSARRQAPPAAAPPAPDGGLSDLPGCGPTPHQISTESYDRRGRSHQISLSYESPQQPTRSTSYLVTPADSRTVPRRSVHDSANSGHRQR